MSGICGILRLDGAPAEGLGAMLALLERRGPDAIRGWQDGHVALGHALLATTPEAVHEVLPLTHTETGCAITADVRLDNREELLTALGLDRAGRTLGDGEIVLHAYLRWGESCPEHLLGDFAFAVWDPRDRTLFAARDQMGMRQLHYAHLPDRVLAFATDAGAVREAPDVPHDLDEGRIADFLEGYLEMIDSEATFYAAVRRLPPAHLLVAAEGGVAIRRYWRLAPGPPLDLPSDEAYEQAFRTVFAEAVRCRLRGAGPVGAMLSGGMDSGSIVAVASRILAEEGRGPLPTFSLVGADADGDPETRGILASAAMPGLRAHILSLGLIEDWMGELAAAMDGTIEPFDSSMSVPHAAYLAAKRAGVRVVLDGVSGDTVFSEGDQLLRLVRAARWSSLWSEVLGEERQWQGRRSRWQILREIVWAAAVPHALRRLRAALPRENAGHPSKGSLLTHDFARRVNLAGRQERFRRSNPPLQGTNRENRAEVVGGLALLVGRERYDRAAALFGIEPRDPFMDLRVIGFLLSCPASQMRRDGWRKHLLRRAMGRELPPSVVWKLGRDHLGPALTAELVRRNALPMPGAASFPHTADKLLLASIGASYGQIHTRTLASKSRWETWFLAHWLASAVKDQADEQR